MATSKKSSGRFVVVVARTPGTNWARVIAGTLAAQSASGERVTLKNARQALYYGRESGGELGLAAFGPRGDSRVSAVAPSADVLGVSIVLDCTEAAVTQWAQAKTWEGK